MVLPLGIATAAFVIGGALGTKASGVIWGLIASAGLLAALRLGKIAFTRLDSAILSGGMISSTVLAVRVMPEAPESVDVILSLGYTLAWLPAAAGAALFAFRRGSTSSQSINIALAWVAAAAIALSAGVTFGVIEPIESLRRGVEPVFGGGHYAVTALTIGLIGIATMFGSLSQLPALTASSVLIFMTVFAGSQVGFTIPGLVENISNIVNVPNLLPPDFDWAMGDAQWWELHKWEFGAPNRANPLVETVRIAIIATVIGVGVALPLAFLASTLTSPNRPSYLIDKGFINLIRTVPDLFWALIFATSVGVGPFAGALALIFFSLAIMSKLLSETVDSADPGPLEAAKSTGSSHFPAVRAAVFPQVLPNYVAYALYIFEINIRASVVLGIVGAGGIGRVLETQRSFFRFDRVLAIVILIFVIVFLVEQVSIAFRRRLV